MRAAIVEALNQPLVVRNVPEPECPPDGAVLRVGANGICRTDWHLWTGDWSWRGLSIEPPFVLGHEFAGVIEEVGRDVRDWRPGDRVVFPMNPGEGRCSLCRSGNAHVCEFGAKLVPGVAYWGAFAERVAVRYADVNLVRLPDDISFVDACGMACRYAAAFHAVVDQAVVRGGEWVVVHGVGGMGLSAVQIAAAVGARVIAVDPSASARRAAESVGAAHVVDPTRVHPLEEIRALTGGGAHVSIDALGIAETCRNSILSLRKLGRHVQIGHTTRLEAGDVALPIDVILLNELRIIGGFGLPATSYDRMIAMVQSGQLEPRKTILQRVGLDDITSVLAAMGEYGTTGIVVIDKF